MDETAVKEAVLLELSGDFAAWGFESDADFQVWVEAIVSTVVGDHAERVGTAHSLEERKYFLAAQYETSSRMLRRATMQGVVASEGERLTINVGPITIQPSSTRTVSIRDLTSIADWYHNLAESRLLAAGIGRRKGAVRVWVPSDRINIA